jgi:hypothetical protein
MNYKRVMGKNNTGPYQQRVNFIEQKKKQTIDLPKNFEYEKKDFRKINTKVYVMEPTKFEDIKYYQEVKIPQTIQISKTIYL